MEEQHLNDDRSVGCRLSIVDGVKEEMNIMYVCEFLVYARTRTRDSEIHKISQNEMVEIECIA